MISNSTERFEVLIIVINDGYLDRIGQQPTKWPSAREKRRWDGMNTKQHMGIFFSAVWLIGAFLFALRSGDIHGFMSFFTLFGVVPLTVGWSIWWIFRHGRPPGTASK